MGSLTPSVSAILLIVSLLNREFRFLEDIDYTGILAFGFAVILVLAFPVYLWVTKQAPYDR